MVFKKTVLNNSDRKSMKLNHEKKIFRDKNLKMSEGKIEHITG